MSEEKVYTTFREYMNDVSPELRAKVEFNAALIGKMIEARENKGLSQRGLAKLTGVKQSAIARLERLKAMPKVDTLMNLLHPLGYTLKIVPLSSNEQDD